MDSSNRLGWNGPLGKQGLGLISTHLLPWVNIQRFLQQLLTEATAKYKALYYDDVLQKWCLNANLQQQKRIFLLIDSNLSANTT